MESRSSFPVKYARLAWLFSIIPFLIFYGRFLTGSKIFRHDSMIWSGVWLTAIRALKDGSIPIWDPLHLTGVPFFPSAHIVGLLDPTALLWLAIGTLTPMDPFLSYVYFYLTRFGIFFIGSYFFFKSVSGFSWVALLGLSVLLLGLGPLAFFQNGGLNSFYLTPWMFLLMKRIYERPSEPGGWRWSLILAALLGISTNIYVPAYFPFQCLLYAAVLVVENPKPIRTIHHHWKKFLLPACTTVLLSLPAVVLGFESLSRQSELFPIVRFIQMHNGVLNGSPGASLAEVFTSDQFRGSGVFSSTYNLAGLLFPEMWRAWYSPNAFYIRNDFMGEFVVYMGMIPLAIGVLGWLSRLRSRKVIWLLPLLATAGMLFNFHGTFNVPKTGLQTFLTTLFPFLRLIHVNENFSWIFNIWLVVGFLFGCLELRDPRAWRRVPAVGVCLCIVKIALTKMLFDRALPLGPVDTAAFLFLVLLIVIGYLASRSLIKRLTACFALGLLSVLDLIFFSGSIRPHMQTQNWLPSPNLRPFAQLDDYRAPFFLVGKDAWPHVVSFTGSLTGVLEAFPKGLHHVLFSTRDYAMLLNDQPFQVLAESFGVTRPILDFTKSAEDLQLTAPQSGTYVLNRDYFDQTLPKLKPLPRNPSLEIKSLNLSSNEMIVELEARESGYLIYKDGWSRYWTAFINHSPISIQKALGAFKAVAIESGAHTVKFVYRPWPYMVAVGCYGFTLMLILGTILFVGTKEIQDRRTS